LLIFENTYSPLFGVVSEILSDEEVTEYKVAPYTGFGAYESLVHRFTESKEEYQAGTPVYLSLTGELSLLDEDEEVSGLVIGYLMKSLNFATEEFSEVVPVYLTYTPLNFGLNSVSFSSLFSMNSGGDFTFGGGHVNFKGGLGEFLRLKTEMLNVSDRIMIYVDEVEERDVPKIEIIDGENTYDLLEEIGKLRKELNELKEPEGE
jgi:hypothetical protein